MRALSIEALHRDGGQRSHAITRRSSRATRFRVQYTALRERCAPSELLILYFRPGSCRCQFSRVLSDEEFQTHVQPWDLQTSDERWSTARWHGHRHPHAARCSAAARKSVRWAFRKAKRRELAYRKRMVLAEARACRIAHECAVSTMADASCGRGRADDTDEWFCSRWCRWVSAQPMNDDAGPLDDYQAAGTEHDAEPFSANEEFDDDDDDDDDGGAAVKPFEASVPPDSWYCLLIRMLLRDESFWISPAERVRVAPSAAWRRRVRAWAKRFQTQLGIEQLAKDECKAALTHASTIPLCPPRADVLSFDADYAGIPSVGRRGRRGLTRTARKQALHQRWARAERGLRLRRRQAADAQRKPSPCVPRPRRDGRPPRQRAACCMSSDDAPCAAAGSNPAMIVPQVPPPPTRKPAARRSVTSSIRRVLRKEAQPSSAAATVLACLSSALACSVLCSCEWRCASAARRDTCISAVSGRTRRLRARAAGRIRYALVADADEARQHGRDKQLVAPRPRKCWSRRGQSSR